MTNPPLASVIINNYNYGRFLRGAIDSALNQTYPHTEVIVVDDGSTDGSPEVIATYKNRIVPVLKTNGGQASTYVAALLTPARAGRSSTETRSNPSSRSTSILAPGPASATSGCFLLATQI